MKNGKAFWFLECSLLKKGWKRALVLPVLAFGASFFLPELVGAAFLAAAAGGCYALQRAEERKGAPLYAFGAFAFVCSLLPVPMVLSLPAAVVLALRGVPLLAVSAILCAGIWALCCEGFSRWTDSSMIVLFAGSTVAAGLSMPVLLLESQFPFWGLLCGAFLLVLLLVLNERLLVWRYPKPVFLPAAFQLQPESFLQKSTRALPEKERLLNFPEPLPREIRGRNLRVYRIFLMQEWVVFRRLWKWMALLWLLPIAGVLAPWLNRFNFSGIRYGEETAGILAAGCILFGVSLFSGTAAASSSAFERTDGMFPFLFSQNLPKLPWLLARLTMPVLLCCMALPVPLFLYYGAGLYLEGVLPVGVMIAGTLWSSLLWTLLSVLCAQCFHRQEEIALVPMGCTIALLATGLWVLNSTLLPGWALAGIAAALLFLFFVIDSICLTRREAGIDWLNPMQDTPANSKVWRNTP